jgi:Xaa-Pro dipeptidase
LGEPSKAWQEIFNVAIESVNNALDILKPGITVGELNDAFLPPIKKAGYKQWTPNFHGVGLAIEEPFSGFPGQPDYQPNTARIIEPGMVLEFEPSVIGPDFKMGTTLGSPVLVTDTGYRLLSKNWKPEVKII